MRRSWTGVAAAAITLAGALLYVKVRMLRVELSYALSQRRAELVRLEQERQALTVELATLRSPARVERIAKEKLGLDRSVSQASTVNAAPEAVP